MIIDMHIHTRFSPCSVIKVHELIQRAREIGLDGICITDHDTVSAKHVLHNIGDKTGLCVIIGMEYATAEGDFLVFSPCHEISGGLTARELSNYVIKQGGVVIPAHPFRKNRPASSAVLESSYIIEAINGRSSYDENELAKNWIRLRGNGTRGIGGSDAHTIKEVGKIVTVFEKNIYVLEDLIKELHSGTYSLLQMTH
jgi:predicted metal-dependent phosphoesterase TrpH